MLRKPLAWTLGLILLGVHSAQSAPDWTLDLGGERFDPEQTQPRAPAGWRAVASGGPALRLVQFQGPIQRNWLKDLRSAGLDVVQYIHPYSYVVWGDALALERAALSPAVRFSGDFQPSWKVQPQQRQFDDTPRPTMLLRVRQASRASFDALLANSGAQLQQQAPLDAQLELVQLLVPGSAYAQLAAQPDVYTVQEIPQDGGARGESSNQSIVGNHGPAPSHTIVPGYADWLSETGYNGDGVRVAIVDGGIRTTHLDLASRMSPCTSAGGSPTSCSTSNNDHGTHVAGAVAGTAVTGTVLGGFLRGQGVAPGAQLVQQRYPSFLSGGGPGGMITNGMLTIYKESALSGALLSNNSWGPSGSPRGYDIPTQQIDMISRDANPDLAGAQPVLPVWSIMNGNGDAGGTCAPSSLGSPDEAKNLFAIGSTKLLSGNSQVAAIFDVSSNSAHGNACDGRRVPHIVAPGCSTDSTHSSSNTAHDSSFCGTSMASPVVSGAVALFIEKYRTEHQGDTPSGALIKAAFTAAAKNLQGFRNADNGVMGHRPDRFQGYGRIDLDAVMNPAQAVVYVDQDSAFSESGQDWSATYHAADPEQPIRIMLSWSDAKGHGLGGSTPAWVNNLDLSVLADEDTYLGNVIGTDGWSATAGSSDDRNNLEAVYLRADQHGGTVTITIDAANIAADALNPFVPGDPAQDFALACYNCSTSPVLGAANLGLQLSAAPTQVQAGQILTLTADIDNLGPDPVSGAKLSLTLPRSLSFVAGSKVAGAGTWACSAVQSEVECVMSAGSLPVDAANIAASLEIEALLDPAVLTVAASITAQVTAEAFSDSAPADNSATVQVDLLANALFKNGFE